MNLRADDTPEENHATEAVAAHGDVAAPQLARPSEVARAADALDNILPFALRRDFIQLLLQSPHRLYLYWTFAHDPHQTLRAAFGELAEHYRLTVRLVKVETGEEFLLDAPRARAQWFEVYPSHVYRAEVGFHAPGRPFVRLLSSNNVTTPPNRASHLSATEQDFQLAADDFTQLLAGAAYERYARGFAGDEREAAAVNETIGAPIAAAVPQDDPARTLSPATLDEYPHR
ncbi:MAG TPA: DUF4912 domain-containing protein [Pyrinomonadaceae bacterium]|nr:DUF4912 domain-containing protein [Pyrinomonadaceae bacterium]